MSNAIMGTVRLFAGNFAPLGFMLCQGQILSISSNTALFSILGTMYGGNGTTTFALPDLRGRVPLGVGQGPGLSSYVEGQTTGSETTALTVNNLPAHNHPLQAHAGGGNQGGPSGNLLAASDQRNSQYSNVTVADATLATTAIGNTGSGTGHSNMQPSLALHYIICTQGIFPSRN